MCALINVSPQSMYYIILATNSLTSEIILGRPRSSSLPSMTIFGSASPCHTNSKFNELTVILLQIHRRLAVLRMDLQIQILLQSVNYLLLGTASEMSMRVVFSSQSRPPTASRYFSVHTSFLPRPELDRRACVSGVRRSSVKKIHELPDASALTDFQRPLFTI